MNNKYYLEETSEVLKQLNTTENGLTSAEAAARLEKNGKNKLKEAEKTPLWKRFIDSISDPMIIMLLVAAAIQAFVNVLEMKDGFKIGDFAPKPPLGNAGGGKKNRSRARIARCLALIVHPLRRVAGGSRVGHRDDRGKSAAPRRLKARRRCLRLGNAGIAEMDVDVNEAGEC